MHHERENVMSDTNKQQLAKTLLELDRNDQAWVINFLVQHLVGAFPSTTKKASKKRCDEMSEEQWEAYFAGKPSLALPEKTPMPADILKATSGKTIKPLKKWL